MRSRSTSGRCGASGGNWVSSSCASFAAPSRSPDASERSRELESDFEQAGVDRQGSAKLVDRAWQLVLPCRQQAKIGERRPGYPARRLAPPPAPRPAPCRSPAWPRQLASPRPASAEGIAAASAARKCGSARRASIALELGVTQSQMRLRILRIVLEDRLERRDERIALNFAGGDRRDSRRQRDAILRVGSRPAALGRTSAAGVAERSQPRRGLAARRRGRRGQLGGLHRAACVSSRAARCGSLADPVARLAGVARQVVQLGLRRGDVLPLAVTHRPQARPAEIEQRRERFGVDRARFQARASDRRHERTAVDVHRRGVENRKDRRTPHPPATHRLQRRPLWARLVP